MKTHTRSAVPSDRGCARKSFFLSFGCTHSEKQGGLGFLELKSGGSEIYRKGGVRVVIIVLGELYAVTRYRVM